MGVSRKTVQRWERGDAVPDARAEDALLELCQEKHIFDASRRQAVHALAPSESALTDLLAGARLGSLPADADPLLDALVPLESGLAEPNPEPTAAGDIVGRDDDLAAIVSALRVSRLVTLTGPGGVGKTRLAREVASVLSSQYADGAPVVHLASVREAGLVAASMAQTLRVRQGAGLTLHDSIVLCLRERDLLLVLDNFEHVLPAVPLVMDVLQSCRGVSVLATSRSPLRVAGEHAHAVAPLPSLDASAPGAELARSAAVVLFAERARAAGSTFVLDDETAPIVAEICNHLDGLPLAIELAAARTRLLSPEQLRARLDRRLPLLASRGRSLPSRQRTLRAAIDWSHDLLSNVQQAAFARLAVFAGTFTVDAAEQVVALPPVEAHAVLDIMEELVDQNLVRNASDGGREGRVELLETIREYATEALDERSETSMVRERHGAWYLELVEAVQREAHGPDQLEWLDRLAADISNVRLALQHAIEQGDANAALRLCIGTAAFWDLRSALSEGREWCERALVCGDAHPALRSAGLTWAAYFAVHQGDIPAAAKLGQEALEIAEERESDRGRGYALLLLSNVAIEEGDLELGIERLEQSLLCLQQAGDTWGTVRPLNNLGECARVRDELDSARGYHEEALAISEDLGDLSSQANILCNLGRVALREGNDAEAARHALQAIEISRPFELAYGIVNGLEVLGIALARQELTTGAVQCWAASDALRSRTGLRMEARDRGEHDDAVVAVRELMGEAAFAGAWETGGSVPLDQLLADTIHAESS